MSAVLQLVGPLPFAEGDPPAISFDGATTLISGLATAYGPAVLAVFGVGLGIAAVVWGFPKLMGLFKKSAK